MKKVRILECIRQGKVGGGESHLLSLMENIDREKFEPCVLSFTHGPMIESLDRLSIPTTVIHTERPFDFTKWKKIRRFIAEQNIQLVHAHGTRAMSNIVIPARKLGIPVIYSIHGWSFHPDQPGWIKRLRKEGEQYLVSHSSLNISVASSNQQTGKRMLRKFDSVVVNNGIDRKKFNPKANYPDIRRELNIPPDDVLFTFIARFTLHKQPLILLESFRKLAKMNSKVHLLMVGDGDQKDEALKMIANWSEKDRITFEPFRQDIPSILASSDVFVLPSLWEGLSIGLLEAMAMEKAVAVTNVDGSKEIIVNGENGLMVEAGNVESLFKALNRYASDENLRKTMGKQAGHTVANGYDAGKMTRQIEEYYSSFVR